MKEDESTGVSNAGKGQIGTQEGKTMESESIESFASRLLKITFLEKAINCWIESCFDSFSTNEFVSSKLVGEAKR